MALKGASGPGTVFLSLPASLDTPCHLDHPLPGLAIHKPVHHAASMFLLALTASVFLTPLRLNLSLVLTGTDYLWSLLALQLASSLGTPPGFLRAISSLMLKLFYSPSGSWLSYFPCSPLKMLSNIQLPVGCYPLAPALVRDGLLSE